MAVMSDHTNVIAPEITIRAAESFYDCGISDATRRPKTQPVENDIHTIRVAGIDDNSFSVCRTTAELSSKF
jgi:hypothetical protein